MSLLKKIKIVPLAAESFGVRSMCTFVETPDVRVLLDAGVSLCPYRFSLPPHQIEFQTIDRLRKSIALAADKAEVVTISHYHFDHHTPSFEDWLVNWTEKTETARRIYEGKRVLLKNPKVKINASQRRRAWIFQKTAGKGAAELEIADGKTFAFGRDTFLRFSDAVSHGTSDSVLGWVVILTIECEGERFTFAPDVQGPMMPETSELIKLLKPDLIMIGGPPFYLRDVKVDEILIQQALNNLAYIVGNVTFTIFEHHALRDAAWREKSEAIYASALAAGHKVMTAAEFLGEKNAFFEARRDKVYSENPPSKEFEKWMRQRIDSKTHVRPPM